MCSELSHPSYGYSYVGLIIKDCIDLLRETRIYVSCVRRSATRVAHSLTRASYAVTVVWRCEL